VEAKTQGVEAKTQGKEVKEQTEEEELPPLIAWLKHRAIFQVEFNDVIEQDLQKIDAKLETHGKLLVGLDGKVGALRSQVTALDDKIVRMDEKFDRRFVGLEDRFGGLEERFVGLEDRFVGLDDKMDLVLTLLTGRVQAKVPSARVASDNS
jgi:hypothetical protein